MNNLKLEILSQQAQEAVACSYCFMPERTLDWKRVPPTRPPDRPDDVAMAPSVGSRYSMTSPRVTVVMRMALRFFPCGMCTTRSGPSVLFYRVITT